MPKKTKTSRARRVKKVRPKEDAFQKERELYTRGVLIRGEAAKRGKDGKLSPGVTHEIVDGEIKRVRYSIV
jgi:hypothetical protein